MVAMNEVYLINLKVAFVSISAENDEISISASVFTFPLVKIFW